MVPPPLLWVPADGSGPGLLATSSHNRAGTLPTSRLVNVVNPHQQRVVYDLQALQGPGTNKTDDE